MSALHSLMEVWAYIAELEGATPERAADIVEEVFEQHRADEACPESARQVAIEVRTVAMIERDAPWEPTR